eukprot:scaffold87602_cov27-Tisochrysis_lutea.AAC.4
MLWRGPRPPVGSGMACVANSAVASRLPTASRAPAAGAGASPPTRTKKAGCETRAWIPIVAMLPSLVRCRVAWHTSPRSSALGIPSSRARSSGIGLVTSRLRLWLKAYSRPIRCFLVALRRCPLSSRVCAPSSTD